MKILDRFQATILCEDLSHYRFLWEFLIDKGLHPRKILLTNQGGGIHMKPHRVCLGGINPIYVPWIRSVSKLLGLNRLP